MKWTIDFVNIESTRLFAHELRKSLQETFSDHAVDWYPSTEQSTTELPPLEKISREFFTYWYDAGSIGDRVQRPSYGEEKILSDGRNAASITIHSPVKNPHGKWPTNSWVSVRHDCISLGHIWRWSQDRTQVPPGVVADIICIECLQSLDTDTILTCLMNAGFMGNLGADHSNEELWNAIAAEESVP